MVAGLIAREYRLEEIQINLRELADRAGVALVIAEINGLNPKEKILHVKNRPPIQFTNLSLNIGSETNLQKVNFSRIKNNVVVPIKPFNKAIEWIRQQDRELDDYHLKPFSVIGSGLAGLEIIFALRKRWPQRSLQLKVFPEKLSKKVRETLLSLEIKIIENENLITGPTLLCTGSDSPQWIKSSGLQLDYSGRVITKTTLQSVQYSNIFAAGDCGVIEKYPRPASGVWAVRAADFLAENIERFSLGLDLLSWRPQRSALQLLSGPFSLNFSLGWAFWKGVVIGPSSLMWRLKKKIDQKFIQMFCQLSAMKDDGSVSHENHLCRGCAAKVSSETLQIALKKADLLELGSKPEDAPVVSSSPTGELLIQSVDGFPALISDPWMNARITALHACSDIWASGATVISAQPLITLPAISSRLQEELLIQILAGIKSVLDMQGAQLIGGHTLESRTTPPSLISLGIQIGLSVNGVVACKQKHWEKDGLEFGDVLLLSRSLGSGVIFAAAMKDSANPMNLDSILNQINTSQHFLLRDLFEIQNKNIDRKIVHACTDITGFGLLGHLSEMLLSSNLRRSKCGIPLLKIKLEAENIPSYNGALDLFKAGYSSTFATENRKFWNLFEMRGELPPLFELSMDRMSIQGEEHQGIMELIVDPQTCGPLLLSCSKEVGKELVNKGPWIQIGSVELI